MKCVERTIVHIGNKTSIHYRRKDIAVMCNRVRLGNEGRHYAKVRYINGVPSYTRHVDENGKTIRR